MKVYLIQYIDHDEQGQEAVIVAENSKEAVTQFRTNVHKAADVDIECVWIRDDSWSGEG